jgi:hypothetical protein
MTSPKAKAIAIARGVAAILRQRGVPHRVRRRAAARRAVAPRREESWRECTGNKGFFRRDLGQGARGDFARGSRPLPASIPTLLRQGSANEGSQGVVRSASPETTRASPTRHAAQGLKTPSLVRDRLPTLPRGCPPTLRELLRPSTGPRARQVWMSMNLPISDALHCSS